VFPVGPEVLKLELLPDRMGRGLKRGGEGVSRFARIWGQILEPISPKRQVLTLSIWYSNQYAIAGEI